MDSDIITVSSAYLKRKSAEIQKKKAPGGLRVQTVDHSRTTSGSLQGAGADASTGTDCGEVGSMDAGRHKEETKTKTLYLIKARGPGGFSFLLSVGAASLLKA